METITMVVPKGLKFGKPYFEPLAVLVSGPKQLDLNPKWY
jgi:hypothetical protein